MLQDCTRALQKRVIQEIEAIIESKRPHLQVRTSVGGSRVLLFDWRSYPLVVRNSGADSGCGARLQRNSLC